MPSMQQRKVKPLEGLVYLPKSENIVAVKLASSLYKLVLQIWETPKDWKDPIIVSVFEKGSRKDCGNYRSIPLLSIAENILVRIFLNRLNEHIVPNILSEARCGIRSEHCGYSWMLSILCLRQLEEKWKEHNMPLHAVLSISQRLLLQCSESMDVLLLIYQSFEGTAQRNVSTCGSRKLYLQGICSHQW